MFQSIYAAGGINSWPSRGDIYMYNFMKRYLTEHVFTVCAIINAPKYIKKTPIADWIIFMEEYHTAQVAIGCLMSMHQGIAKLLIWWRRCNLTKIVRTGFNKSNPKLANDSANKIIKCALTTLTIWKFRHVITPNGICVGLGLKFCVVYETDIKINILTMYALSSTCVGNPFQT